MPVNGTTETIEMIHKGLPDQFWMVEASMPELFSASRKKFGEVIICPEGDNVTFGPCSLISMRLPSCVIVRSVNDCSKQQYHNSSIQGHTSVYSSAPSR
jgi:hypothetical protein